MNYDLIFSNLTENEKKVLNVFLEIRSGTTTDITKHTGISRPNTYDILNKLIQKGALTKQTYNTQVRYTINTLNTEELIEHKQAELTQLTKQLTSYNTHIKTLTEDPHTVEIYTGAKQLHDFCIQTLNTKTITTFGAEGILEEQYPHTWNAWMKKLEEHNITLNVIYTEQSRHLREKRHIPLITHKYITRDIPTHVTTQILDEQVNLFHWDRTPLIIVIKSKRIAQAYREEFNLMWKHAQK